MILKKDWEFNILQVYNYQKPGKLDSYFNFIKNNHEKIEGDICEIGVYRGSSLVATALFLKEIGSDKKVWGFDNFSGFPGYHKYDSLSFFKTLYQQGDISKEHYDQHLLNIQHKEILTGDVLNPSNISTSSDFSGTSRLLLEKKIDYFELDNIEIIDGNFEDTMKSGALKGLKFMASLMDCDLYESHHTALPFVWGKMPVGGYMFLDEYYSLKFPGARIAINKFFLNKLNKPEMDTHKETDFERWSVKKISE